MEGETNQNWGPSRLCEAKTRAQGSPVWGRGIPGSKAWSHLTYSVSTAEPQRRGVTALHSLTYQGYSGD